MDQISFADCPIFDRNLSVFADKIGKVHHLEREKGAFLFRFARLSSFREGRDYKTDHSLTAVLAVVHSVLDVILLRTMFLYIVFSSRYIMDTDFIICKRHSAERPSLSD